LRKHFFLLISVLLIVSCGPKLHQRLDANIGKNINQVVNEIGYPDRELMAPNGNKVYVFENRRIYTTSAQFKTSPDEKKVGNVTYVGTKTEQVSGAKTNVYECQLYLEVDDNENVIKWRTKGGSCRRFY